VTASRWRLTACEASDYFVKPAAPARRVMGTTVIGEMVPATLIAVFLIHGGLLRRPAFRQQVEAAAAAEALVSKVPSAA
jgi:hypothetical protein